MLLWVQGSGFRVSHPLGELITRAWPKYRVLYVRNLPFNISAEELYEIFGKYGAIRQIRQVHITPVKQYGLGHLSAEHITSAFACLYMQRIDDKSYVIWVNSLQV